MLTMHVRGLPRSMTQTSLEQLFAAHGRVFDLQMSRDLFSGECKGFAQLKMEGHHARAAIADVVETGSTLAANQLRVLDEIGRYEAVLIQNLRPRDSEMADRAPMPCTVPPAICPSTTLGLIIGPVVSEPPSRRRAPENVSRSSSALPRSASMRMKN